MLKAIIFDFDGVIGDTYDINFELSREFDPNITEQDFQDHHNGNVFEEPKIHFQKKDIPLFFKKQKQKFTRKNFFDIEIAVEGFARKSKLFIVSSTTDENIEYFLKLGGVLKYFEAILGKTTHKSKIEKFRIIFEKYNLRPEECIFITDTIGDIKESRHFSIKTIAVTWGYHPRKLLESENPFAIVDNTNELIHIIEDIQNEF